MDERRGPDAGGQETYVTTHAPTSELERTRQRHLVLFGRSFTCLGLEVPCRLVSGERRLTSRDCVPSPGGEEETRLAGIVDGYVPLPTADAGEN